MSYKSVEEGQKALQKIEEQLAEVEEEAKTQFDKWYALYDKRNASITLLRDLVRTTPFKGKAVDYGTYTIRRHEVEEVDISTLRRKAPEVFNLPGVVTKVDPKALRTAIESEDITKEQAEVVEDCIDKVEKTPRIYGPKVLEF
jgi:hypothetical protein